MSQLHWLGFVVASSAAIAFSFWLYRRRELPTIAWWVGGALRAGSLCVVLLLLFDPFVPGTGAGPRRVVVLDDSYSMGLPVAPDAPMTRWQRALRMARAADADAILTTSGRGLSDSLEPTALRSALSPALRAAAESGADEVLLLSDAAVEDAPAAIRLAADAGLAVRTEPVVDAAVPNVAVARAEAPAWAKPGDSIQVRVEVAATGAAQDSVQLVLRSDTTVVGRQRVALPAPGLRTPAAFRVRTDPSAGGAVVAYTVALQSSDAVPADDVRPVYVELAERPAGVVLVSFRPDWEPRFLLPVVERAVGLPARGYLRLGTGEFLPVAREPAGGRPVAEPAVRAALGEATLVIVQGLDADSPAWARALLDRPRVLVLASALADAGDDVVGAPLPGDWYPAAELPTSPLLPLLAGADWGELSPLRGLRALRLPPGGWSALLAQRDRRGPSRPVLVGWRDGERRRILANGAGYYRWALSGGDAREAYRALWSAAGSWLVEGAVAAGLERVRPVRRVFERGQPIAWTASGADSVRLTMRRVTAPGAAALRGAGAADEAPAADAPVVDTIMVGAPGAQLESRALPPGRYRYQVRAMHADAAGEVITGELAVAGFTPELVTPARELDFAQPVRREDDARAASRLHTQWWAWTLLLALLCAEWLLRRRMGLR